MHNRQHIGYIYIIWLYYCGIKNSIFCRMKTYHKIDVMILLIRRGQSFDMLGYMRHRLWVTGTVHEIS
jgi:hypothetical protein